MAQSELEHLFFGLVAAQLTVGIARDPAGDAKWTKALEIIQQFRSRSVSSMSSSSDFSMSMGHLGLFRWISRVGSCQLGGRSIN